ncbi:MAG: cupin domain-containing protein [Desulfobacterales bacterium]|nr:cupin domain-containing protein [Desulfobacterales bacterium]
MDINIKNIFEDIPKDLSNELFEDILRSKNFRIERIVSKGHRSPEGFWYDQEQNEWVILLKGSAGLRFENEDKIIELTAGDYINIPSHVKHRVEWTDLDQEAIWLAIYY